MHVAYTADQLARWTGGTCFGPQDASFARLATDSRKLHFPGDTLFVALKGPRHDGHEYTLSAYEAGVRLFLTQHKMELPGDATQVVVTDSLRGLQALAAAHRHRHNLPVVGITGSNGKTVVKEWLNLLLAAHFSVVRSPRSYNSQVGVPLSVWNLGPNHEMALFEAGISQPGEMRALANLIGPSHVVLTNVRDAHLEHFVDRQALAREKALLCVDAHTVVYCADYPHWKRAFADLDIVPPRALSWTLRNNEARWCVSKVAPGRYALVSKERTVHLDLPDGDEASLENAIHAVVLSLDLGLEPATLQPVLRRLDAVPMRLELLEGKRDCTLLSDVYSSDPASLEIALDALERHAEDRPKVAVLSDMEQTGQPPKVWAEELSDTLEEHGITHVLGVGPQITAHADAFAAEVHAYPDTATLIAGGRLDQLRGAAVLIKGSRKHALEKVTAALSRRTHDTLLEVDLTAAEHNYHYFRSRVKPAVRMMAMVKASGYGAGAGELAQLLAFNQVDYLAVAYVDEGVMLRQAGVSVPIMVMNPERSALDAMLQHRLEPEVYSWNTLEGVLGALEERPQEAPLSIHIKLDTGMHRLGFEPEDLEQLGTRLAQTPNLWVATTFTHLSAADDPNATDWSLQQLDRFQASYDRLVATLGYRPLRHALNTAGMLTLDEQYQFDMVRLGIGLYGVSPVEHARKDLLPVNTLRTVISQVKTLPAGEPVGYGRSHVAAHPQQVATLPLGYADGLPRALSNGIGEVWIAGQRCKILGRVCMDMTMVDVTGLEVEEGDEVEVFGRHLPVEEVAAAAGTISYEILAAIPQRVRRVYVQD
ncbi:MAG: bifunctional UDP-N-acetylmuramoyl-tripeptide:D-alanyl-D-alanine ligase/alanine racemase [Flavobacteriales bacterium]